MAESLEWSPSVLVVDDDDSIREVLSLFLGMEGYRVTCASDGAAALAALRTSRYDIVISDLKMPKLGGLELLQEVSLINPEALTIIMTGFGTVESAISAMKRGAHDYVLKPFKAEEMIRIIRRALEQQRLDGVRNTERPHAVLQANFDRVMRSMWIAYQPIVTAREGRVFGHEALLRSDESTLPTPAAVLETAEQLDLIEMLGRNIRDLAARPYNEGHGDGLLFVNLHGSDLEDPMLFSAGASLTQIAHRVVLEITERSSLDQLHDLETRVRRLRDLGFRIAVDDLGAGYNGLRAVTQLEPEIVKLDMTLVQGIHRNKTKQKVVRSMTNLAKDIGALVVGEGVESANDQAALIDLGCDLLQGFLFGCPDRWKA